MSAPVISEFVDITINIADAQAAKVNFGLPIGIFDHSVTANRVDGPYSSIDAVTAAGFTAAAEPEVFGWASSMFNQNPGVDEVKIGRQDVGDADWTATWNAVIAEDDDFYGVNIESRAEADILLVAAAVEPTGSTEKPKIFIAQSSDAALLAGTVGNVGEDLQTQGYHRTALVHHAIDDSTGGVDESDGYLDSAWTSRCLGFNLDAPGGRGQWIFKRLTGVPFNDLTDAEVSNVKGVNANVYGVTKALSFVSNGTMASGRFIDVTTTADWLKDRLESEILTTLVNDPVGIDLTTAGLNKLRRAGNTVLGNGIAYGHLTPDQPQIINWPTANQITAAERIARTITATGTLYLAGGLIKVNLTLTLVV